MKQAQLAGQQLLDGLHRKAELLEALVCEKQVETDALRRLDLIGLEAGRKSQLSLLEAIDNASAQAREALRALWASVGLEAEGDARISVLASRLHTQQAEPLLRAAESVRTLAMQVAELSRGNAVAAHRGRELVMSATGLLSVGNSTGERGPVYSASGKALRAAPMSSLLRNA